MATLPKPKSIPQDIYDAKLVKIANDEVTKTHNELFALSNYFSFHFRLYRIFANISMIALVFGVFTYGGVYFYIPVAIFLITAVLSHIMLNVTEEAINGIIVLNTQKETMIYELYIKEFISKE
jgi:hypothetical protein